MSRTTRIIGHMVTRNELDRYLRSSLAWLRMLCDLVVVYDDGSTDGTVEYLRSEGISVRRRPSGSPSFNEDESAFRAAGWNYLHTTVRPKSADWILAVDADEYLVTPDGSPLHDAVLSEIEDARGAGRQAITVKVAEIFGWMSTGELAVRTDGYWGEITACRLVQWREDWHFHPRREGGGSVPSNWRTTEALANRLQLLHLGYATSDDREIRFNRYSGGRGHNPTHVASIQSHAIVRPWTGMIPDDLQ